MGYVIVGGVCLMIGGWIGMLVMACLCIDKNTESVEPKAESEIYMGTCSLSATHNVPEEVKQDADW